MRGEENCWSCKKKKKKKKTSKELWSNIVVSYHSEHKRLCVFKNVKSPCNSPGEVTPPLTVSAGSWKVNKLNYRSFTRGLTTAWLQPNASCYCKPGGAVTLEAVKSAAVSLTHTSSASRGFTSKVKSGQVFHSWRLNPPPVLTAVVDTSWASISTYIKIWKYSQAVISFLEASSHNDAVSLSLTVFALPLTDILTDCQLPLVFMSVGKITVNDLNCFLGSAGRSDTVVESLIPLISSLIFFKTL